jgi:hypothetical protein
MGSYHFELLPAASSRERLAPLWARSTDWGELTPELIEHYAVNAPGGPASVVTAATESGDLVGATFFVPVRVMVCGRQVRAHRPSAFLLDPSARVGMIHVDPKGHPTMGMYFFAADQFRALGDSLLVTIPNPRWARVLKLIPGMQSTMFPLMSLPLPLRKELPWNDGYRARNLITFDSRIDELGAAVATQYNCTIRRDTRLLEWKINRGDAVVTGVERNGELVGVVVSRKKGDRQWLICDLLAADAGDALTMTLVAAAKVAHARALADVRPEPLHKVGVLATPLMMPILEQLGFYRDEYDFPLAVHQLDPSVSRADIAPERWYVTADD